MLDGVTLVSALAELFGKVESFEKHYSEQVCGAKQSIAGWVLVVHE